MQQFKYLLVFSIVSTLLVSCASLNQIDTASENFDNTIKILATKHHVCGIAIAIIKNRKLDSLHTTSGCQPNLTLNSSSTFQAASLSKPVFAYTVLKLVEQQKIELDTPLIQYFPQSYHHRFNPLEDEPYDTVTDPQIKTITPRMILNHTSGLPNWAAGPLHFEANPGKKWIYSGEGYVLLQHAVENIMNQPLDQLINELLFKPLDMSNSSYILNKQLAQNLVSGTKANGKPRKTKKFTKPISAFSLTTTATDYGMFLVAVLNDTPILKQIIESPVVVNKNLNLEWGLGWGIERTPKDSYIWHWGNNTGYRAFVMASTKTGDGFVMLTNSENGLKLAEPITQKILPDEHKLFQFPMLGNDILTVLCNNLSICF